MVVLVLIVILLLQSEIFYSTAFGRLNTIAFNSVRVFTSGWIAFRIVLILVLVILWILNRKKALFKTVIFVNCVLTLGLFLNLTELVDVLVGLNIKTARVLLVEVFFMSVTNILIFSIWYWIIDPPGVEEEQKLDQPWDFLFAQRSESLPFYESWLPRYTDYLYLAFTTSYAFSPADVVPLSRRAKLLMLMQSIVSIITLTAIAGNAISILAGSG